MHCGKKWWIREFVAPSYISFKSWLCCCSLPSVAPQQLLLKINIITGINKKQQLYIIKRMINIAIRATYYIFCWRNRNWNNPDLMQFWFFFLTFVLFCFVFVFGFVFFLLLLFFVAVFFVVVFFFLIIQYQAAFVNCLYVARFTIVRSKTQIKFPLLLLLLPDNCTIQY